MSTNEHHCGRSSDGSSQLQASQSERPGARLRVGRGAGRQGASTLGRMPRWLWWFIALIVIFAFIIPDPAGAGAAIGNAIDSMIIFFQSLGYAAAT